MPTLKFRMLSRNLVAALAACSFVWCSASLQAQSRAIAWETDIEAGLQEAARLGRPALIEFTADWCVHCKRMEKSTFTDARVIQQVSDRFVAVRVNADRDKALIRELGIKGLPAMLVVGSDLQIIERITGYQTAESLLGRLDGAALPAAQPAPPAPEIRPSSQPTITVRTTPAADDISHPTSFASPPPAFADATAASAADQNPFAASVANEPAWATAPKTVNSESGRASLPSLADESNPFALPDAQPAPAQPTPARQAPAQSGRVSLDDLGTAAPAQQSPASHSESAAPVDPNALPLAFSGECPVTAIDEHRIASGSPEWRVACRDREVRFSSLEARTRFEQDPAKYWPMMDGVCPLTLAETGQPAEGDLRFAVMFRQRIWLLRDQAAMDTFVAHPAETVQTALIHYQNLVTSNDR